MTNPSACSVRKENIPVELKDLMQWVGWKAVPKGNGKTDKLPVNPKTGALAEVDDPTTWGSLGAALQAVNKYRLNGIGFVFSEADPYCGIDLDSCRNPETKEIESWAAEYLSQFQSYSETTPSDKGFHIIIKGKLPPIGRRKGTIEVYDSGRFFTFTGNVLNGNSSIESRQGQLEAFHKSVFGDKEKQQATTKTEYPALDLDDEELLKIARNAANGGKFTLLWNGQWQEAGYPSQSEADQALCNQLAYWTGKDAARIERLFRQSGLYRNKWEKRADYRKATIENAIRATTNVFDPNRNGGRIESRKTVCTPTKKAPPTCEAALESNEFPLDACSGMALRFAELFSSYTESPPQFYYFSFLTCLGSILADKATLESQIEPQPRLNTLLLGESADDRKSTAIDQTVKFFHKFSMDKILNVCHGLGSAEGLQARLDETKGPNGISKLILIFDEFKSFVSKCKIEGSVLLPCVTTLFESNRYESRTKNTNIKLDNAYLSVLAASTVQTFQNIWTSQFTDIGFGNRLWIVTGSGERRFSIPRKIPEHDLNRLKRELSEILNLFVDRVEMSIEPDAFDLFDKWYLGLEGSVHSKRIDTYALRLMPLLAANEGKILVDADTVRRVIRLCDWQLQTRKLHDPIDCDNAIAKMEEKIRRNLKAKGPLKEWQLKQATGANRDGLFVFDNAKKNLMRANEVMWDKSTKRYFEVCHENS